MSTCTSSRPRQASFQGIGAFDCMAIWVSRELEKEVESGALKRALEACEGQNGCADW